MNSNYELAALELAERGWAILPYFLAPENIAALRGEAEQYAGEQRFRAAGIGRGSGQAARADIRGDQILWLNPQQPTPAQTPYWTAMDELRQTLNRELFLSLVSLEAHYAVYEPGAFYRRHVDRFQSSDERVISTTLYLNSGWSESDGGQLRLYSEEAQNEDAAERANESLNAPPNKAPVSYVDVLPHAGTLALFRSDTVPHEVLPATRPRYSLTGWFRRRSRLGF